MHDPWPVVASVKSWQHWHPVGSLRFFSGEDNGRSSRVHRFDGKAARFVPCDTVCAANCTYTEDVEREREFWGRAERELPRLTRAFIGGKLVDRVEQLELFSYVALLSARNPSFALPPSTERLSVVVPVWQAIIRGVFDVAADVPSEDALRRVTEIFMATWDMCTWISPHGGLFSSENPAIWVAAQHGPRQIWAPLSPTHYVVFARRGSRWPARFLSRTDVHNLNRMQVIYSDGAVFSARPFGDVERENLRLDFEERAFRERQRRVKPNGVVVESLSPPELTQAVWNWRHRGHRGERAWSGFVAPLVNGVGPQPTTFEVARTRR